MSQTPEAPALLSQAEQALAGLPSHTNDPASYQGQRGYWVQAEAKFVPCSSPATAIAYYRQRLAASDIAVDHNLGTACVGRIKLFAAHEDFRQQVAAELRRMLVHMSEPIVRDGEIWPLTREEKEWASHNERIKAAATRLGLELPR